MSTSSVPAEIRRLTPADAAEYRAVMLRAYAHDPMAFTATVREREALPLDWWAMRMSDRPEASQSVVGAFVEGVMVGTVGVRFEGRERTRHKAWIYGMCVAPEQRGRGLGRALVEAILGEARGRGGVLLVQLTVAETNREARRLYEACGFRAFGTEPLALRLEERSGEGFVSLVHMWRPLEAEPGAAAPGSREESW